MIDRRWMFALSVGLSLAAHAVVVIFAPNITVVGAIELPPELAQRYRVRMLDEPPPPLEPPEPRPGLATKPEAIRDLLTRDAEELTPIESLLRKTVDVPLLSERLAGEEVAREYELGQDAAVAETIDAKIIEIAETTARRDVEVVRRLVRPSPVRVLEEHETPVFRGEVDRAVDEVLSFGKPHPADGAKRPEDAAARAQAAIEGGVPTPDSAITQDPVDVMERTLASSQVAEAIRRETPYEFIDDLVGVTIDTYLPPDEDKGYFRLRIAPKKGEAIEVLPKDLTFIIDASKSIAQWKLNETIKGVIQVIAALRPEDCFNIVVFRDTSTSFKPERVPATRENKAAAETFLEGLERGGETDVYRAIRPVLGQAPRDGLPGVVFVISDGKPTTGILDGRTIINALTAENKQGNTIYAFGGGRTVNEQLLDLLAYRNKGAAKVAERIEEIQQELPEFIGRLQDPILVGLEADYGSTAHNEVYPKEIPDFYKGQVVTVYGRFDPEEENEFVMRLRGLAGDRKKEVLFRADLGEAASGDAQIAYNWAFSKIYDLIGEMYLEGETPERLAQVRDLSRKYGIRTSYDE
ncbi:MAG TPA: VWA domain-containing protein [Candidatus Hydrogenedentes bacterium]|nr:VWA domain-containing protein [Candidatus Hydrogenedentota bacterium]HIJ75008.1 VWA domain-containing protein [Candidatus Hydrogenedentota bacterium]